MVEFCVNSLLTEYFFCLRLQIAGGENSQWLAVWIIIAVATLVVLLIIALYVFVFRRRESQEERQLRLAISALRVRLGITFAQGFPLSSEHSFSLNWLWRRQEQQVIVQHSYMEEAARLSLFLDFDIHKFDAFCLCLQCSGANTSMCDGDGDDFLPAAYRALRSWLLDISQQLIQPTIPAAKATGKDTPLSKEVKPELKKCCTLPEELRFPYFLKLVSKCRIWSEFGGRLFKELKKYAQV